jgi:hypothetical protein
MPVPLPSHREEHPPMTLSDDLTYDPVYDRLDAIADATADDEPEFGLGEPRAVRSYSRERRRRAHRDWQARDRASRGIGARAEWSYLW